jgi:hypothetical protein
VGGIVDANSDPTDLAEGVEITPTVQVIRNPAREPSDYWSIFFGFRLRAAL